MKHSTVLKALTGFAGASQAFNGHDTQKPLGAAARPGSESRPNVVFILTDDQDLHMDSLDYMPLLKKHLIDQGTQYNNHYTTTAICCPARVSLWTGKAAHNTNVTDLQPPYGMATSVGVE